MKDGRIIKVRGVTEDRVQLGEVCVKADLMTELVYNPHRLRTPMKRTGGENRVPVQQGLIRSRAVWMSGMMGDWFLRT